MEELGCRHLESQGLRLAHEFKICEEAQGGEEWRICGQVDYLVQQW